MLQPLAYQRHAGGGVLARWRAGRLKGHDPPGTHTARVPQQHPSNTAAFNDVCATPDHVAIRAGSPCKPPCTDARRPQPLGQPLPSLTRPALTAPARPPARTSPAQPIHPTPPTARTTALFAPALQPLRQHTLPAPSPHPLPPVHSPLLLPQSPLPHASSLLRCHYFCPLCLTTTSCSEPTLTTRTQPTVCAGGQGWRTSQLPVVVRHSGHQYVLPLGRIARTHSVSAQHLRFTARLTPPPPECCRFLRAVQAVRQSVSASTALPSRSGANPHGHKAAGALARARAHTRARPSLYP